MQLRDADQRRKHLRQCRHNFTTGMRSSKKVRASLVVNQSADLPAFEDEAFEQSFLCRLGLPHSEEYAARLNVDEQLGAGKVRNFRSKAVGEQVIEYPADDMNPDDVPF